MMPWCHGWSCRPPLIASHIHSVHVWSAEAHFNEVRRHISAPLHFHTNEAWLVFSNSWCLSRGNDFGAMGTRGQMHWLLNKKFAPSLICFSLLCHDCILVGGSAWCRLFWVLPHGWPVSLQHDIHLMRMACTLAGSRKCKLPRCTMDITMICSMS